MSVMVHMFKSKIHRATVTDADLDYEGSVTIDAELMAEADIFEHEQVHIWNVTQGTRLVTYAIRGAPQSGVVCINGAAAHLAKPGDQVIISTFAEIPRSTARSWKPKVVLVDGQNRVTESSHEEMAAPDLPA